MFWINTIKQKYLECEIKWSYRNANIQQCDPKRQ